LARCLPAVSRPPSSSSRLHIRSVKRTCVGIWKCSKCHKVIAGGAYMLATPPAVTSRSTIARLRQKQQQQE
jgi:large subunit ribosomal protein L37Ae